MYVLGIDGGGTKTAGVIADINGKVAAKATVGPSNPNSVNLITIEKELTKLFNDLHSQNEKVFLQIKHVFAGMSGGDHLSVRSKLNDIILSLLPHTSITIHNDAITALYSGTLGKPGIVQIAGTGSITYGINKKGTFDRAGGWGYLLGEKGSGYALGSDGLKAAFIAHDGLGEATALNDLILEHLQMQSLPDIIPAVYHTENTKEWIASLSKIVVNAADQGDHVARNIIKEHAQYMGESISCLMKRMFTENDAIPVVLTGGLFNRADLFIGTIEEMLRNQDMEAKLSIPKIKPVGGAVIAAFKEENMEISNNFLQYFEVSEGEY